MSDQRDAGKCSAVELVTVTQIRRASRSLGSALHSLALCSAHAHQGSDRGTGADRVCSSQCLCWVYTSTALQGVYTAICHATLKTVKTPFIIYIS